MPRAAGDVIRGGAFAGCANDVENNAALPLFHNAQEFAHDADVTENLSVPALPPRLRIDVLNRAAGYRASIIHDDVNVAMIYRESSNGLFVGQIGRHRGHRPR